MTKTKEKTLQEILPKMTPAQKEAWAQVRKLNEGYTKVYEEEFKSSQIAALEALAIYESAKKSYDSVASLSMSQSLIDMAMAELKEAQEVFTKAYDATFEAQEKVFRISKFLRPLKS